MPGAQFHKDIKTDTIEGRLKYALHIKNIKIGEAAKAMGIGRRMLHFYLAGRLQIPEEMLDSLLLQRNISKKYLLKNIGDIEAKPEEVMEVIDKGIETLIKIRSDYKLANIVKKLIPASQKDIKNIEALVTEYFANKNSPK